MSCRCGDEVCKCACGCDGRELCKYAWGYLNERCKYYYGCRVERCVNVLVDVGMRFVNILVKEEMRVVLMCLWMKG